MKCKLAKKSPTAATTGSLAPARSIACGRNQRGMN